MNWTKSFTHGSDNAHSTGYLMLRHDISIKEFYQFKKKKNRDCDSARKMTHKMLRTMFVMSRYSFSSYSHHRIFLVSNRAKWQRLLMTPLFVLFRTKNDCPWGGGVPLGILGGGVPHARFQTRPLRSIPVFSSDF